MRNTSQQPDATCTEDSGRTGAVRRVGHEGGRGGRRRGPRGQGPGGRPGSPGRRGQRRPGSGRPRPGGRGAPAAAAATREGRRLDEFTHALYSRVDSPALTSRANERETVDW